LEGGKFKSVLHCRRAKFAYDCTDEYLTTAVDLTGLRGESGDGESLQFSVSLVSSCTSGECWTDIRKYLQQILLTKCMTVNILHVKINNE
jgi:hypothetical protein